MKLKNKGRKIYKTKEKNYYGKSPLGKFFSALLSVVLIGGIGFLGYSVAGPLINYTRKQGDEEPENVSAMEEVSAEISEGKTDGNGDDNSEETEDNIYRAVLLSEYDMASVESIKTAVGRIPQGQGIEYIEVPLKLKSGNLAYKSASQEVNDLMNTEAEITLQEIVRAIKKEGYTPSARISTLADNNIPNDFPQYSYIIPETFSVWHDRNDDMWASPFASDYISYLTFVADEISEAGFEKIICSDLAFPDFDERDLKAIGDIRLEDGGRYKALADTARVLYRKITSNNSDMLIEVSAPDVISGKAEILKTQSDYTNNIVLYIDLDEIGGGVDTGSTVYEFNGSASENVMKMLGLAEEKLDGFGVSVRISGNSNNTAEIIRAKDDMAEKGFTSFILG